MKKLVFRLILALNVLQSEKPKKATDLIDVAVAAYQLGVKVEWYEANHYVALLTLTPSSPPPPK